MNKPREVDYTDAALRLFAGAFGRMRNADLAKLNFVKAWTNRQKRLSRQNAHKPHQGAGECERRRRQLAKRQIG